MSRDYFAKRLAKELDIPYTEALRRVQADSARGAEIEPAEKLTKEERHDG